MKNILVVGYPRSGNTFLGYLLSYYFNAPYYDMYDYPRIVSGQYTLEQMLLSPEAFSGTFERSDQEKQVNAILKSHELPKDIQLEHKDALEQFDHTDSGPLILIARDPKDVAVSYFYYVFFRTKSKERHWTSYLPYAVRHWYYKQFHFKDFVLKVAREWSHFTTEWIEANPLVINYENLLTKPIQQIQRVCAEFGFSYSQKYAEEATVFCDFSNMTKLEEANPEYGAGRKGERFVRSGKKGQWQDLFNSALRSRFDDITRESSTLVGYGNE